MLEKMTEPIGFLGLVDTARVTKKLTSDRRARFHRDKNRCDSRRLMDSVFHKKNRSGF